MQHITSHMAVITIKPQRLICRGWVFPVFLGITALTPKPERFLVRNDPEAVFFGCRTFSTHLGWFREELEDRIRELFLRWVIAIVGHELVHDGP